MALACENIHASIGEYQRNYLYKFYIENIPTPVLANFPQALAFSSEVDIYNQKAIYPNRDTAAIKIKWCGEFFEIPGVDQSKRDAELQFVDDESKWVYDFFSACKDLTGNEKNHAGVYGIQAKFNIGIAKVSVDKNTITQYRRLVGVRVYGVDSSECDKEGETISTVKVTIRWDKNVEDKTMRNKTA